MTRQRNKTPLQGITLEQIVSDLFAQYGWEELGRRIKIRCFTSDPSVKSSLNFLRKTPWARKKVERLYLATHKRISAGNNKAVTPPASIWCKKDSANDRPS